MCGFISLAVILYQTAIFVVIQIAARAGAGRMWGVAAALGVFTITHVFLPSLMVLQFGTIGVSLYVGHRYVKRRKKSPRIGPTNEPLIPE